VEGDFGSVGYLILFFRFRYGRGEAHQNIKDEAEIKRIVEDAPREGSVSEGDVERRHRADKK